MIVDKFLTFYDVETTGLGERMRDANGDITFAESEAVEVTSWPDQIIQLAAYTVEILPDGKWKKAGEFERKLTFAAERADPGALEVNHWTEAVWSKEAMTPREVAEDFAEYLGGHRGTWKIGKESGKPYTVAAMAGHNVRGFDQLFVERWLESCGYLTKPDGTFGKWFSGDLYNGLDTLQLAHWWRRICGVSFEEMPTNKLEALAEYFGITFQAHDALEDVKANARVAKAMLGQINAHGAAQGV